MVLSKSDKTKLIILEAAVLTLSKQPNATLNDIADTANIGRATLHRHFKKRKELIKVLALKAIDDIQKVCCPALEKAINSKEALNNIVSVLIPLGHQYRFLATDQVCYSDPEVNEKYNHHLNQLAQLGQNFIIEQEIADDIPLVWIVAVIDALIYAAWFGAKDGYIVERDAAPLAVRSILYGLK